MGINNPRGSFGPKFTTRSKENLMLPQTLVPNNLLFQGPKILEPSESQIWSQINDKRHTLSQAV